MGVLLDAEVEMVVAAQVQKILKGFTCTGTINTIAVTITMGTGPTITSIIISMLHCRITIIIADDGVRGDLSVQEQQQQPLALGKI
jgi:hypothetical protein